ncbi:hypothetical protein [Methylocella tundrae]|uniref:Uncharacterized protein n=1 Tax=Methylocella tundrae TaxID=227605 RepID=A0A4U8Z1L3_METTU|nr:hypothetical protein [Methylocella tundrae]WPP06429.1 hypothetical protein SIN04_11955 [Methylocella tundrae]VFU09197.1 conserved protein of unknown function [Methylocella tundrae]
MTSIAETPFGSLDAEGRLLNAVLKGPTDKPGRFGYRGEIALKFAQQFADEKRPPELTTEQVIAVADAGKPTIPFLAAYLLSFEHLQALAEVLQGKLTPEGKYFAFCNNIDLLSKYRVEIVDVPFYVLPLDESTVYNELLELLNLDKTDLKKLSVGGKTDAVAEAALKFDAKFDPITFAQGVERMGPIRNRYEHRPV